MKTPGKVTTRLLLALVAILAGGCAKEAVPVPARIGHHLRSDKSVLRLHRAVFITMNDRKGTPQIAEGMTNALIGAIQRRQLFHIDVLSPTDPACEGLPLDQRRGLSMKQLAQLREALKCDAVILGAVSHWQTYPRMQIGIYLRLLDLRNGLPVWVVDHIWDSTDKQTEARIREFFQKEMRSGYDPAQWRLALMSPKVFQKFVAYETANTLPSRVPLEEKEETGGLLGFLDFRKKPGKTKNF